MRFFRNLATVMLAFVLAACAGTAMTTPAGQIETASRTVEAYVEMTIVSLQRGRITPDQAAQASANAKRARDALVAARAALTACRGVLPCTDATALLQNLQPTLYEIERQLRAQQGAK